MREHTTCQVCGRAIKATTGLIAHHGYRRPYQTGWQTASCEGARYVPYEVSCDRLREVVEMVKQFIASLLERLANFLTVPPQTITVLERRSCWDSGNTVIYEKPEDFSEESYRRMTPRTYENAYNNQKYDYERAIRAAKVDLSIMERRLLAWGNVVVQGSTLDQKVR